MRKAEHGIETSFASFHATAEPALRRALVARYGAETGREAAAEALAYAWEHWDRIRGMDNPMGYLYRVGQSKSRRFRGRRVGFPAPHAVGVPWIEPGLDTALARLSSNQRQVVVLVHAYDHTHAEVADLLGMSRSTVQNHLERGLIKLRRALEVDDE